MRVVSLFSGAGGLDLGFRNAGHDLSWANDNDKDCKDTYMANISKHFQLGNISDISYKDIPDSEILIGGFPCQGFSCANMKRSKDDERNEMYLQFVRILRVKTPNFFVAENVRGILSLEKGLVLKMILEDFRESGYHVQYTLVNAADYGVPQNRFRVFFIGVREDLKIPVPSIPAPTHSKNDEHLKTPWVTIKEALERIPEPDTKHFLTNHVCSKYKITNRNFTGHRRTDPDKPSPTILARGNGKGGVCALQHYKNHRRLSVRESALIQTFPIDFVFKGNLGSMYRQVGNAVPVKLAEIVGSVFL